MQYTQEKKFFEENQLKVRYKRLISIGCQLKQLLTFPIFSAECTIGMVWGVGLAKALWQ